MGPLPIWDVVRRHADVGPLVTWALEVVRKAGFGVERLEDLHRVADATDAVRIAERLTLESRSFAHRPLLFGVLREAIPELMWNEVAVQSLTHFRILVPGDDASPVPPHTDRGIGHPLDERNIWIALTDAVGASALQVMALDASMPLETKRAAERGYLVDVDEVETKWRRPVVRGDILLFTPLHVHAAQPVEVDSTRVSIDVRIAPAAEAIARHPAGYVHVRSA